MFPPDTDGILERVYSNPQRAEVCAEINTGRRWPMEEVFWAVHPVPSAPQCPRLLNLSVSRDIIAAPWSGIARPSDRWETRQAVLLLFAKSRQVLMAARGSCFNGTFTKMSACSASEHVLYFHAVLKYTTWSTGRSKTKLCHTPLWPTRFHNAKRAVPRVGILESVYWVWRQSRILTWVWKEMPPCLRSVNFDLDSVHILRVDNKHV